MEAPALCGHTVCSVAKPSGHRALLFLISLFTSEPHNTDLDFTLWLASSLWCSCRGNWHQAAEMQPDVTEKDSFCFIARRLNCFAVLLVDERDTEIMTHQSTCVSYPFLFSSTLKLTFCHINKRVSSFF